MLRSRRGFGIAWLLAGALAPAGAGAASGPTLSVCIDQASATAPRDLALAQRVAQFQNLALRVHRFDGAGDDDGLEAKDFRALLAGQCDLVLGFPVDATGGEAPSGLAMTAPYDQTGYVLATAPPLPSTGLADLPAGTEVAVTYGAVPNLYFVTHRNVQADIELTEEATLKALIDGREKAAMLWQPTVTVYQAAHPGAKFSVHDLAEPHARFNIVALYAPTGAAVAARFEAGMPRKSGMLDGGAPHRFGLGADSPRRFVKLASVDVDAVPALYTSAQASAGAQKYSDNCAQCHGDALEGQAGPALKGNLFASAKSAFSVGDIMNFMAINMPATQPGSLSHDDYTDIMAYVLAQNGYPAGSTALTFEGGSASHVPLRYYGK
jgi:mono/diheme cytochrome c family protein